MRNYLKGTRDFNYFLEMLVIGDVGIEKKDTRLKDLQGCFFELSQKAIKQGYNLFDHLLFRSNFYACYAQKEHTYTIDTKGNLLKCTVALYDEENKIGNLDSFVIDDQKQKLWINNYEFSQKCSKYQLLLICKGGACPKRDIFNERTFNEKCQRMRQNILQNFELAILSNKVNYKLKVE